MGSPSASSAAANTAAAAGEDSARARPMPTNWLPWPGNTSAIWLISPKRTPERAPPTPADPCTFAGIDGRSYARSGEDRPVTDIDESRTPPSVPPRRARPCVRRTKASDPAAGPGPARGPRPRPPPGRLEPGDRPHLRGRPLGPGRRRRDADPERPPDLRARRDGPRAVARARRRVRVPARRAQPRLHAARRAVRARRGLDDDGRRPRRRDRAVAVRHLAAGRRAGQAAARRAAARGRRRPAADGVADASAARRCCGWSTGRAPSSSSRRCGRCRAASGR